MRWPAQPTPPPTGPGTATGLQQHGGLQSDDSCQVPVMTLLRQPPKHGRTALLRVVALACLSLGLVAPAMAQRQSNFTVGERALLPPFCEESMGFRSGSDVGQMGPNAPYWFGLMGKSFVTMHHYCYGLIKERRALAPGQTLFNRNALLEQAVNEYQYVIDNALANFVLLPDVFVQRGDMQALLKRYLDAIESYREARERKPDYWRAYSRWATALVALNNPKSALTVLEDGIRAVPSDPKLRAQYKALGGDPNKFPITPPKPAAAPEAAAAASAPAPAATASAPAPAPANPPPAASAPNN